MAKIFFIVLLSLSSVTALARLKVIYGEDDRRDIHEVQSELLKRLAAGTAAMVENRKIQHDTNGRCFLRFDETLETGQNVCPGERFSQQSIGALCSGFLVGEDTLVTAGHCLRLLSGMGYPTPEAVCRGFSWVFNYALDSAGRDPRIGNSSDVYACKSVVVAQLSADQDFAVLRLERKVTNRLPLKIRTSGKIADNAPLVVIGHPTGLPSKISGGARVLANTSTTTFLTNLDTFQGNSGSAVFDANTGLLEGILIQGQTDYRPSDLRDSRSCQVVNRCANEGHSCELPTLFPNAPKGEVVTRITQISPYLRSAPVPSWLQRLWPRR